LGPVGGGADLEPLELQTHGEQFDDVGLVIDNEDSRLRFRFARGWGCHEVILA
jgi:hypothetical protein